jgi:hypothetical protein
VTYHASATLIEFASSESLEQALETWPESEHSPPQRVAERLLLAQDDSAIPFHRFRLAGSRDYRRPAEPCVEIDRDGVTLSLDLGRSDLFIDAELARFADEARVSQSPDATRRKFVVSPASLIRGLGDGVNAAALSRWFADRAGLEVPPAIRLLLHASQDPQPPLRLDRPVVLTTPTDDLLDGLLQHPSTRSLLGERLGPAAVLVPEESREQLRIALSALGLRFNDLLRNP